MAYTAIYSGTDLGSMIVDLIGIAFNAMGGWMGLLILAAILGILVYVFRNLLKGVFGLIPGSR